MGDEEPPAGGNRQTDGRGRAEARTDARAEARANGVLAAANGGARTTRGRPRMEVC